MTLSETATQQVTNLPCVCTTVRRADRALNRLYDDALRPSGLATTQYALLSRLGRAPDPIAHHQLAETMAMAGTTLSRNLTPLARDGLVHIEPGQDRRTRLVSITAQGQAALDRARPLWQSVQERLIAEAGEARIAHLLAELNDLVDHVQP
jgi:DNA-binding MarR family transcriptional regulator